MDLWAVAAAAGAGYVAKDIYLKNSSTRDREDPLESVCSHCVHSQYQSWNILQQVREITCPLCRLAATKKTATDRDCIRFPSTINLSNPEFTKESSHFPTLTGSKHLRHGSSVNILKLSNSSENCSPRMYGEHTGIDDRITLLPVLSYTNVARTLAEKSQVTQSNSHKRQDGLFLLTKEKRCSNPAKSRRSSRSITRVDNGSFSSQGAPIGMVLFFLGITMGMMSTNAATEGEINNLNELLKQMANLVQDLHEEIKMKDQLTVKELHSQESETGGTSEESSRFGAQHEFISQEFHKTTRLSGNENPDNLKTMSKIEEELEAELQRLEMDIKSSSLQRVRNFFEDPDQKVVQGNTELDKLNDQPDRLSESDRDATETLTDNLHTENYALSPVELSLRLHEVIQLRLATRIMELEAALENSQSRLRALHSVTAIPCRDVESSSTKDEPAFVE